MQVRITRTLVYEGDEKAIKDHLAGFETAQRKAEEASCEMMN